MGRVIPPGLVAEDCVIPTKANAAMGTWFPYLLKGIEPSRFEAARAGLTGRGRSRLEVSAVCGGWGERFFLVFIGLHLRVQLFLSFGVWMKGRLLWNANA